MIRIRCSKEILRVQVPRLSLDVKINHCSTTFAMRISIDFYTKKMFSKITEKICMQHASLRIFNHDVSWWYKLWFQSEMDFGSLLCWATNSIGRQEQPCVYHLTPAGRPDPVTNCTITNQSYSTMRVTCQPGFDGGLRQVFFFYFNQQ